MLSRIEYILSKKTEGIDRTPLALSFVELFVYVKQRIKVFSSLMLSYQF